MVLIFDFLLKNMRAWFIDLTGQEIDLQVGEDIYRRVLEAPLDKVAGPVGGLASIIKGFDQVREFFHFSNPGTGCGSAFCVFIRVCNLSDFRPAGDHPLVCNPHCHRGGLDRATVHRPACGKSSGNW